ncbi:MAG TPA: PEP-CTERM sorting domain-containing protein [Terriglobales bacterium]|nr:PEP-CTERM sorting domain-containing protein [Terriglobales bacterium]
MKRLTLLLAVFALMMTFTLTASADDINFSGALTLTQVGSTSSPAVNFTFGAMTVTAMGGDALEGSVVTIGGAPGFTFTSVVGSNGYFSPNGGTISIGNATTGTLTGDINFVTITSNGFGGYALSVSVSNINVTTGTSSFLTALGNSATNGSGVFTFQFTTAGSLNDLLNMGLSGALANRSTISTSGSGSVAVPEPASLFLLGSGLMAGGGFVRRKLKR